MPKLRTERVAGSQASHEQTGLNTCYGQLTGQNFDIFANDRSSLGTIFRQFLAFSPENGEKCAHCLCIIFLKYQAYYLSKQALIGADDCSDIV